MKLKAKFTIIVSILVCIFLLTAFFAFSDYEKSIKETIAQQQFLMISALADEIDSKLLTAQQHLIAVARTAPPDIMQNPEKAQAYLDNKQILYTTFDNHAFLVTPAGKIFVESPYAPGRRGMDISFRDYIINTLKTKKPYVSDPYVSSQPHKHPVIMLTVPIFDGKGKITGILTGGIDLMRDNFLGRISTVRIGKEGYLYLTDKKRTMIMHPDKKKILTKQPPGLNRLYDKAVEGFEGTDDTTTYFGIKMVASFKRLKSRNWILAANYPSVEAYRPIRQAEHYFFMATITGITAIFFIIIFIMKYLIGPLEFFTRHFEELPQKTGDDRFLNIKTKDEIGTLSLAFNKMVTEIDKRSELERSEDMYRTITEFSTDFIFWRAPDSKIIYVSENCEKFCGYTEEELYASPELLETMIHPEDRTVWAEHSKGSLEPIEFRIITKSGDIRWIAHSCLPVYDKQGNHRGERASHRDITERKQAEDALKKAHDELESRVEERTMELSAVNAALRTEVSVRKLAEESLQGSEEKFRVVTSSLAEGIYVLNERGHTIYMNPEAEHLLGWTFAELSGKNAHDTIHYRKADGSSMSLEQCPIRNVITTGIRYVSRDEVFVRKDGTVFPASVVASPIMEEGKVVAAVTAFRDITERKNLEEALKNSEYKYRTLLENVPEKIFLKDRNSVYISCNDNYANDLKISPSQISGMTDYDFYPEELAEKYRADDKRIMETGKTEDIEEKYILNGSEYIVHTIKTPVRDDKGNIAAILGVFRDITDRKNAEQLIKRSLKEKEILLREIHHRVKNNMAVVSSLLSLQAGTIKDDTVRSLFEESQQRVKSMALVHEKLYQTKDLSSINFEDYIKSIVSEIINLYRIDARAITTEINIEDIELDLESAVPCGLIINELLTNAFKYAFPDNRGGAISVHFTKTDDTYTLVIKDNGVGLPKGLEYKEARTLGLRLVKVLTGQLRGTLEIKSDKGTEVVVTFKTKRK